MDSVRVCILESGMLGFIYWLSNYCVTLGKAVNFSEPQIPHLDNGDNNISLSMLL